MNRYSICCLTLLFLVGEVAGRAFSTDSAIISNSTYIGVKASDAMTLTEISWNLQGYVVVYFDRLATDVLRFTSGEDETLRYGRRRGSCCGKNTPLNKKCAHVLTDAYVRSLVLDSSPPYNYPKYTRSNQLHRSMCLFVDAAGGVDRLVGNRTRHQRAQHTCQHMSTNGGKGPEATATT